MSKKTFNALYKRERDAYFAKQEEKRKAAEAQRQQEEEQSEQDFLKVFVQFWPHAGEALVEENTTGTYRVLFPLHTSLDYKKIPNVRLSSDTKDWYYKKPSISISGMVKPTTEGVLGYITYTNVPDSYPSDRRYEYWSRISETSRIKFTPGQLVESLPPDFIDSCREAINGERLRRKERIKAELQREIAALTIRIDLLTKEADTLPTPMIRIAMAARET